MLKQSMISIVVILSNGLPTGATHSYNEGLAEAEAAKPMSRSVLSRLYRNKTWQWKDGSAYFGFNRFTAHTKSNGQENFAVGTWRATDKGEMCFTANWFGANYKVRKTSCFPHREANGTVYQQTPEGFWYVFKHSTPLVDDEYQKLKTGNVAVGEFMATRNRVSRERRK